MSALYELTAEFKEVADRLEEMELDAVTIRDTLDGYSTDFDNKVVAIASLIRNIESTAVAIKEAEDQMATRRKALDNRAAWLREYVINNMKAIGKESVDCPFFSVKVKTNAPSVIISDDCDLPVRFVSQKLVVSPDKKALKAALESGEVVEGVSLVRSNSLSIK